MVVNPVPSIMPKGAARGRTLSGIRAPVIERYFEIFIFLYEIFISGLTYILICMKLSNMHISRRRTVYRCNDHIDVQVRKYMIHVVDANACITYLQMLIDSPYRWIYLYIYMHTCVYTYIAWHDKSQSFLHIARKTPTNPLSNPTKAKKQWESHEAQPLIQTPMFSIATLWPFNETAPLAGAATAWCVPFVTCVTVGRRSGDRRWKNARKAALSRGDARHGWPGKTPATYDTSCGVMNSRGWWTGSNVP